MGFLLELHANYRPLARFGPGTTVVTDPRLAVEVLRDRTGAFGVSENFLQQRVTAAEMALRLGPRPLLNAALRPAALHRVAELVAQRIATLDRGGRAGGWFDPVPALELVYSRTMAELFFGPGAEDLAARIGLLLDELAHVIGNPFALPGWTHSPTRRRIESRYQQVSELVLSRLDERARGPGRYEDLAGAIMSANHGAHPPSRIGDMIIGALLAGQRVPAAAGSWLLMLLADHPDVQQSLRDQPDGPSVAACASATASATGRSHALRPHALGPGESLTTRVVLEALRLYPATWILARRAETNVEVAGWRFPAGHSFLISPYALHRGHDLFGEPERFDPNRWHTPTTQQTSFLTFGAGTHLCPGRSLTAELLATTINSLIPSYVIERGPGRVTPDPRTTLLPTGLTIRLAPRPPDPSRVCAHAGDGGRAVRVRRKVPDRQAPARFAAGPVSV